MTSFAQLQQGDWPALLDTVRPEVRAARSLAEAGAYVSRRIYERFEESAVLVRVYATTRYDELPADVARFVDAVAAQADAPSTITAETRVLALLGTWGVEEAWRDRRASVGHRGIPLVSAQFVDALPMVARLVDELGIELTWLDEAPEVMTRRLIGGFNGIFYVGDASAARDAKGRRIIPASDFVERHDVRTVFGMGGFYPDGTLIVCVVFTRDRLPRATVEPLASLISMLKGETFGLVRSRRLFD